MSLSIHKISTHIIISVFVFFTVLILIVPHLMDVEPPIIVRILLKPTEIIGGFIGQFLPHPNIGTEENPFYEGTPIDILVALIVIIFNVFLYPFITYLLLSLLSNFLKNRTDAESKLNII